MRRLSSLPVVVGLIMGLGGCTAPYPTHTEVHLGRLGEPIEGGALDDTDTWVVGIVEKTSNQNEIYICSGSLIAPNVVLTAQHCVANISTGDGVECGVSTFGPPASPFDLYVTTHTNLSQADIMGDYHTTQQVVVGPNKGVCGNDVALLVLGKGQTFLSVEATPHVPRVDVPVQAKEKYSAIGYGQTSDAGQAGTRFRRNDLFARCMGSACASPEVAKAEWVGDTGICHGDSGGPAMDVQDRVIGVVSRGEPGCTLPEYSDVSSFADLIKQTVVKATADAGIPTPDWATGYPTDPIFHYPIGGSCDQASACPSNACIDGYCTRSCNAAAVCPSGFICGSNGFCERYPVGTSCSKASDCPSNACLDGYCTRSCDPNTACPTKYSCGASGYCEQQKPIAEQLGDDQGSQAGCALAGGQDPTKPIPWIVSAAVGLAWLARRRRGRG